MARRNRRFPAKPIVLGALQLAAASTVAGPTVTPPQTVHVIQAPQAASHQQDRARSSSRVYAPRPQTLYVPRVTFDAATSGGSSTFSHTCTGTNRYLVVGVAIGDTTTVVTGVTYAGVAMQPLNRSVGSAFGAEVWGLANPASGTNSVVVTLSSGVGTARGAVSFVNAAQTGQPGQTGANSATSIPVSSASLWSPYGSMLVDVLGTDTSISVQAPTQQGWIDGGGDGQAYRQSEGVFATTNWTKSASTAWVDAAAVVLPVGFQAQQPRQTIIQPASASAKVQTRRRGSVTAPRPAALAVTQAAPTVTPARTVWVIQAQLRRQGRAAQSIAPRPAALANHAILQAGSPRTVTVIDSDALAWRRAQHASRIIEPRPSALTNHAILSAGLPQTVTVKPARTPSRARRSAEIVAPRPSGLTFTPAAPATPPRTAWVIEAQTPRQHLRGSVIAPRPSGLVFTPAAPSVPPRTVWVIEAHPPRPARHSAVLSPRPQGLIFTSAAVTTPPRTVTIITARTAAGRVVRARVVAPRPVFAPVTAPRPVVIDQAPLAKRKPLLGRITSLKGPLPVAAPTTPPKPVIVQSKPQRRMRRGGVLHALRQRFATGAGPAPTLITTPATGYVTVDSSAVVPQTADTAQPNVGSVAVPTLVAATGLPTSSYAPTGSVLGYSNNALGTTDVAAMEALIGRSFHGLRQNADISANWVNTGAHISQFDLGRTSSYRAVQLDPATQTYAAAISGTYDANFTTMVTNIVNSHRWSTTNPFIVCFQHEPTLASNDPLGTAQQFIDAFRHYRLLLDSLNASVTSVTGAAVGGPIVMAYIGQNRMFTNGSVNSPPAGKSYTDYDPDLGSSPAPPGTTYYTLAGSDVYNNLVSGSLQYGTSAATLLDDVKAQATSRGKDWMIGELAASDGATSQNHQDKAAWYDSVRVYLDGLGTSSPGVCRKVFTTIKTDAALYNIDSSAESIAAWQRLGNDSYYG